MTLPGHQTEPDTGVRALIDRITASGLQTAANAAVSDARAPNVFDLEGLLAGDAHSAFKKLSMSDLDLLRRKIEVARKLFQRYESDLSRPVTAMPLSNAGVNQLCAVMLLAALYQLDARFLNSAFKLIDGLSFPTGVTVSPELVAIAKATLDTLIPMEPGR